MLGKTKKKYRKKAKEYPATEIKKCGKQNTLNQMRSITADHKTEKYRTKGEKVIKQEEVTY